MRIFLTSLLLAFFAAHSLQAQNRYELRLIKNSPTFTQVIAVNSKLEVIGIREVQDGAITAQKNFFRKGDQDVEIRVPEGFSNIEVQALSDSGIVAGYTSRPLGGSEGSVHAFVWDSQTDVLTRLSPLDGDVSSNAQDISADGKMVTGYSVGNMPPRMRPCVWSQSDDGKWNSVVLETVLDVNPYLQASQVLISPNGKYVAACITEKQISEFIYDSSLFVWAHDSNRGWERRKVSEEQPKLKDINDEGVMVGSVSDGNVTQACQVTLAGQLNRIDFLPGDVSSVAYGINNAGTIVGVSDDPPGNDGGPRAFRVKSGVLSPLPLPKDTVDSAALTINQQGVVGGFLYRESEDHAETTAFIGIPAEQ